MSSQQDYPEFDFGYDPTKDEPIEITPPPAPLSKVPPSAMVNSEYLPPVGKQLQIPSCVAWGFSYGLATFTAAAAGNYSPNNPSLQASPGYIYIGVMEGDGVSQDTCTGSQIMSYYDILAKGGTPNFQNAPYEQNCASLWQNYGGQSLGPDSAFTLTSIAAVNAKKPDDIKQILASGSALAYGTSLYTDFPPYRGNPVPYVGNGVILMNKKTGKPAGHCMLIIGYDDTVGSGAFYIQNSFGAGWGSKGYIWMAYDTFTALAQGKAFYVQV